MAINLNNPVGYGKEFNASSRAVKNYKFRSRQIISRRADVQRQWLDGWTQKDMATHHSVSLDTIKRDVKVVTHRLLSSPLVDAGIVLTRSMARLEVLHRWAWEKLRSLPKNATGGKLVEEIRKIIELETKLVGAGQMNTRNIRVQSVTANLTTAQIDEIVNASNNEFDGLKRLADVGGDIIDASEPV